MNQAADRNAVLHAKTAEFLLRRWSVIGVEDDLDNPAGIPQIDEDNPSVVSAATDPTRQGDFGTNVGGS